MSTYSKLAVTGDLMRQCGLPDKFVSDAINTALEYEGVAELICLWAEEESAEEKDEIIADIQELVDDCSITHIRNYNKNLMDNFKELQKQLDTLRQRILLNIHEIGGILELSKRTQIPTAYLDRLLNTNSIPRQPSLLKITKALDLNFSATWYYQEPKEDDSQFAKF